MKTTLLLVRHGESAANGKGFFAGQTDIELSDRGRMQAEKVADWLFENYQVDKIYSSDLKRAYDTAEFIAKKYALQIQKTGALREINAGEWQGKTFDELQKSYADGYGVWLKDIGNAKCPQGETVEGLYDRIQRTVFNIIKENEGKNIVIVTHATPIRVLCCWALGVSLVDMKKVAWVSNASVTEIRVSAGERVLHQMSTDEYLVGFQTSFPANV